MSRLKLDENLSRHLKPILTSFGHDVETVEDEGLLGKLDPVIASAASTETRMLLTLDVEFADLRKYPPGSHSGIVLFRPETYGANSVSEFVRRFIESADLTDLAGCVAVVDPRRVRIRRPR